MDIWLGEFLPFFGGVYFVSLPDRMPSSDFVLVNLIVTAVLLIICRYAKRVSRPLVVYASIGLLIHLISCLFFAFFRAYFPYSLADYSELYMKQQVGIWFSFVAIAGVVSGAITEARFSKYLMVIAVAAYSFIFGSLRYVVFLAFLSRASSLYMAVLLFIFGPFFDFLYLVSIYSVYINHLIIRFDDRTKGVDWQWS